MSDGGSRPKDAPKWQPDTPDGGISEPLAGSAPEATAGEIASAVSGSTTRSGHTRWDGELAGERPSLGMAIVPYSPETIYQGSPGIPITGPTAPGVPPSPYSSVLPPPEGPPPPPYSGTPRQSGSPLPYPPRVKKQSNLGAIIAIVVSVVILISAVAASGIVRGFNAVTDAISDGVARDLVTDTLERERRYYRDRGRYATAEELSDTSEKSSGSSPRPASYVESDPRGGSIEVKVTLDGPDRLCLTARAKDGSYWSIGEIVDGNSRSTYYMEKKFSDPLAVCGADTIRAGRKGGFQTATPPRK